MAELLRAEGRSVPASLRAKVALGEFLVYGPVRDQIGLTFQYSSKPKAADIFTSQYLPPKEQRLVK